MGPINLKVTQFRAITDLTFTQFSHSDYERIIASLPPEQQARLLNCDWIIRKP